MTGDGDSISDLSFLQETKRKLNLSLSLYMFQKSQQQEAYSREISDYNEK